LTCLVTMPTTLESRANLRDQTRQNGKCAHEIPLRQLFVVSASWWPSLLFTCRSTGQSTALTYREKGALKQESENMLELWKKGKFCQKFFTVNYGAHVDMIYVYSYLCNSGNTKLISWCLLSFIFHNLSWLYLVLPCLA
jgi:hypothetical protein